MAQASDQTHPPRSPAAVDIDRRSPRVPLELWIFAAFSVLVVAADFTLLLFGPHRLHVAVVSLTGWEASAAYLGGLPCVWLLIRKRDLRGRTGITWILLIYIAFSVLEGFLFPPRASTNPFLAVHPYRLLWTVALPALWLLVLRSPRIRDYCKSPPTAEGAQAH
jgi:hypothetical protein